MKSKPVFPGRGRPEWLSSLPVFALLFLALVIGTGEMLHGQLLRMGERMFGDPASNVQYFMLRADPVRPECDPHQDIDAAMAAHAAAPAAGDLFSELFAGEPQSPAALKASLESAKALCVRKFKAYDSITAHLTPELRAYRTLETGFFGLFRFGSENRPLVLMLLFAVAATSATLRVHHISLRPPRYRIDFVIHGLFMVAANALLLFSSWFYYNKVLLGSGLEIEQPALNLLTIVLFGVLTVISLMRLIRSPATAEQGGSLGLALLSVPLYAYMAIAASVFFLGQRHFAGLAIYLGQLFEFSGIFLNLALYIWAGMLFKQTRVVRLFLDILRPWKFSPETLTWIVLVAAAVPTAYTGASGIFVIAAGAIIYKEVLLAGGRRQYALAAAAMSGSLGVVLRPCLLIVLIAALNKQVTSNELYGWGIGVFLMTSTIFLLVSLCLRERKVREPVDFASALRESASAFGPLSPYIVIAMLVIYGYQSLLGASLDEFTAPVILPIVMLGIVLFDKIRREPKALAVLNNPAAERRLSMRQAVRFATHETTGHIGALLMLMALSVSVGGCIERSGIMDSVPQHMGNIWLTLTLLMGMLIAIGMIMDPFGAVILVSATIAPVAYHNGIHPVHFWMIVLTAFELGYLSPPVALNQLLTRMVVGEQEMASADAEVRHKSFYYRYERWVLPLMVMLVGLMIVVYGGQVLVERYAGAPGLQAVPG